jgi:hypothetical protein
VKNSSETDISSGRLLWPSSFCFFFRLTKENEKENEKEKKVGEFSTLFSQKKKGMRRR